MVEPAKIVSQRAETVTVRLVRSLLQFTSATYGVDVPGPSLDDPDTRVTSSVYESLIGQCATSSGDRFFGLHLGEAFQVSSLGALGFLLLNSRDLHHALERYQTFQKNVGDGIDFQLRNLSGQTSIQLKTGAHSSEQRHRIESFASAVLQACRGLVGSEFTFARVSFAHGVEPGSAYRKSLGVQPEEGKQNRLFFDSKWLKSSIRGADVELAGLVEGELRRRSRATESMASKVRGVLAAKKTDRWPSSQEVAATVGFSVRSLQAKLAEEGKSFRKVQDELLLDLALHFLKAGDSLAEISFALHFNEPAAFSRAFKRWTGLSPGQFRRSKL